MSIVISIVKLPENASNTKNTHTFAQQGGTIGRAPENQWVLEDPERFISSKHSEISFENGQYYITDLSTNGTFSNGAAEPIGKGNTIQLNDGDKFSLGEYEFLASVWKQEEQTAASIDAPVNFSQGPFSDVAAAPESAPQINSAAEQDYFSSASSSNVDNFASPLAGHVPDSDSLFSPDPVETDPLAALDNARQIPATNPFESDVFSAVSHSDQANPVQQAVNWPDASVETGAIPENWDNDLLDSSSQATNHNSFSVNKVSAEEHSANTSSSDKKSALEKANEKILAEISILKKQAQKQALKEQREKNNPQAQPPETKTARKVTGAEESLIDALGLGSHELSNEKIIEINQIVGELVRETISGMMQVLSSRSTIKNEFRMNVTTIQPVENNPLKFSANADDAIENMFIKEGNAYKKPVEAIKEGFEGIAEHQIAILAGIRTAFKGVLERFDPDKLEQRFEKFNKSTIIPGMNKVKNWDSYTRYYNELVDDMDNSFQHLFGYEFVQAYEEQLQKLAISRKTKNS